MFRSRPPSTNRRPPKTTGGYTNGMADDARTADATDTFAAVSASSHACLPAVMSVADSRSRVFFLFSRSPKVMFGPTVFESNWRIRSSISSPLNQP